MHPSRAFLKSPLVKFLNPTGMERPDASCLQREREREREREERERGGEKD